MSSNRLIYDRCAYATEIKESTEPLEYNLFLGKFENCKQCPVGNYPNILPFGPRTATESELWGIDRLATNCPDKKFQANSHYNNPPLSAAIMCESIYYITPNNLEKPTSNMLNEKNLGVNFCPSKKTVEKVSHNPANMSRHDVAAMLQNMSAPQQQHYFSTLSVSKLKEFKREQLAAIPHHDMIRMSGYLTQSQINQLDDMTIQALNNKYGSRLVKSQ